jgi:phage terminase large subunit-like protein
MSRKKISKPLGHRTKAELARRDPGALPERPQGLNRNLRNWWAKALAEFGAVLTPADGDLLLSYCQARAAKDVPTAQAVAARFEARPGFGRPSPTPEPETPLDAESSPRPGIPAVDCAEAAKAYAKHVLAGRIVAGKLVKQACERFLADLEEGPSRGITFSRDAAQHVADYLARLGLSLLPWQHFLTANLFGFLRADGLRRFLSGYVQVAKKAGKSTLLAGYGLYMSDPQGDGEFQAEVYVAATTKFQSQSICYKKALELRETCPEVSERSEGLAAQIAFEGGGIFAPLAANSDKLNGLNIHFGILDELSDHSSAGLYNVFRTSTVGRRQPLILSITTAGQTRQSIAWEVRAHAEQVLEGVIPDDAFFVFIAELDKGDDLYDEENWPKANVSLGVTQHINTLRQNAKDAKVIRRTRSDFERFNLNHWPDQEVEESFFKLSVLEKQGNAHLNESERLLSPDKRIAAARERLKGRPCHAGLDLAITEDLSVFCLLFPPLEEDGIYELLFDFFCPEESIELRSREQRVPYDIWTREGFITATQGNVTDFKKVRSVILERSKQYQIVETGFDVAMAQDLALDLRDAGMAMTQVKQGSWLDSAIQRMERLFVAGRLCFHGHPITLWNLSNAIVSRNSQNRYRFEKDKAREKIDAAVAIACAFEVFLSSEKVVSSPYTSRGIIFLDDWDEFNRKERGKNAQSS